MIELRPYQREALDTIISAIPQTDNILISAATGAGKTIIFCKLIKELLTQWPYIRIGILAHRRELISQAHQKLLKVWPEAPIGIACASTGVVVDTEKPVVIGSVQTLANRIKTTAPFDLVVIDECHRIPPLNKKSQYRTWIQKMKEYNPKVRIFGCTATPFRLAHGYIYGNVCKPGNINLFESLDYRIGIKQLQADGYLCEYRAREAENIENDLRTVRVHGDYNIGDLSDVMSKQEHVGSAVNAVKKYAPDRKRIVIFCVTIAHAEKVASAFIEAGYRAAYVHSEMSLGQRDMVLRHFEHGGIQVVCNVGVLTEGWDSPAVDCVLLCRPTTSTGLYVQMVGRGLRPHPDKKDVLILDLSNNCRSHGDPDSPIINISNKTIGSSPVVKVCPSCLHVVFSAVKICPSCGYEWPIAANEYNGNVSMKTVSWQQQKPEPFVVRVEHTTVADYISKKGNRMLKLGMMCRSGNSYTTMHINEFFDFEGNSGGWMQSKSRQKWIHIVKTEPPESLAEAMNRQGELLMSIPNEIEAIEKGKWLNVHRWGVAPWNREDPDEAPF